ncbi:unnamed protein product [Allacma fusca]|uniref:Uncharacterized protein n=1 Tax=Allacma fusca TaxID=39272 RepID=A0A8J2L800_9HEXA|nr:unnamed protein product [Allacma fusca]
MEASRICLLSGIICISFYFLLIEAGESGKCENLDIRMTQAEMMILQECIKEVGAESWTNLSKQHMACFGKCVIIKQNLVDEMGTPHVENIVTAVNQSLPESVRGDLVNLMEQCLNEHAPKVDPKEESCQSYTPLMTCIHVSYLKVCSSSG